MIYNIEQIEHEIKKLINSMAMERKKQKISQHALEHITGIPHGQLSKIENHKHEPKLSTIYAIALGLEKTIKLYDENEDNQTEESTNHHIQMFVNLAKKYYPDTCVQDNEIILSHKRSIYFKIDDVVSKTDLKYKVLSALTRPAGKDNNPHMRQNMKRLINEYLHTSFSEDEFAIIYDKVGQNTNRGLLVQFIQSNYDLDLLKK